MVGPLAASASGDTCRGEAAVPRGVGACQEAAPVLAMAWGWRRAVVRAEGIARAWFVFTKAGFGEAVGEAVLKHVDTKS